MSTEALLSRADGSDEAVELRDWKPGDISDDVLLWVDIEDPSADELKVAIAALRLSDEAAESLQGDPGRPDTAVLDGAVELVILALGEELDAEPIPLQILAGLGWVLTRHREPIPFLEKHRDAIGDQRQVGRLAPHDFLVSILDRHVDSFFAAATELEAEVDKLDDAALRSEHDLLDRLVQMRRRIARVRRVLAPQREAYSELARPDFFTGLDEAETAPLHEVRQRLERAGEAIGHAREMLIGTFDVHMTRTAQRTNDTMKVLTLASVILLPSVVLAGVMGMNFKVGLFDNPSMFWVVIGLMLVMAVVTLSVARWRRWL